MKANIAGKKSFLAFFAELIAHNHANNRRQDTRFASSPRADKQILEELNFDNVAYLSDN